MIITLLLHIIAWPIISYNYDFGLHIIIKIEQ